MDYYRMQFAEVSQFYRFFNGINSAEELRLYLLLRGQVEKELGL
jgi:hypothetical protein